MIALAAVTGCAQNPAPKATEPPSWPPNDPIASGWKRIQVGDAFSFDAPLDTQTIPLQGIDSSVGGYKSDRFNLSFDYGAFSNSLSAETPWTEIAGHKARLEVESGDCQVLPDDHHNWQLGGSVYVELRPIPDRLALTMSGCAADQAGLEELRQVYLSLRFNPKATSSKRR
jgi:hypothetical protein